MPATITPLQKPKQASRKLTQEIERDHTFQERVCLTCGVVTEILKRRCRDRLCSPCRWREFSALNRDLQCLNIPPSHFVHWVLPVCSIPLHRLRPRHIDALKNAVTTIRRHAWFKNAVHGGC